MNRVRLKQQLEKLHDLLNISNLLSWDAATKMPESAMALRGRQLATLGEMAQQLLLSAEFEEALNVAKDSQQKTEIDIQEDKVLTEAIAYFKKIPTDFTVEHTKTVSMANIAWREARAKNDFKLFEPHLTKIVEQKRVFADLVGYDNHPYEAVLAESEPDISVNQLTLLFNQLRERLLPLVKKVHSAPKPDNDFLFKHYSVEKQKELSENFAAKIGYDFSRGRLDTTVHPFEISMSPNDVRITTRFNPQFLNAGLFGTLHESGHAIYEQNISPRLQDTALSLDLRGLWATGGSSVGVHESQSRLWENLIGRSYAFWQNHYQFLQETFKENLEDISIDAFYRAINRSEPSLIRVEADELTYDFHIMLRTEIEMGLMAGSLSVKELPEYWNSKMQEYLGIRPKTDSEGVLQDIHWSKGKIGYFPTYTIGNVMGSQFMVAAKQQLPDLQNQLSQANYQPLFDWLVENIHQHGRNYSPDQLLVRTTGKSIDATDYLDYLEKKYTALYDL